MESDLYLFKSVDQARLRGAAAGCIARAPKARSGRYFHLFADMSQDFCDLKKFSPSFMNPLRV
ncbi:hypothetical protein PWR63_18120 [Paraburkholderia sp. A2WS-5]|uniref:hypothetical protein n=1 Tax=unclassified Paraburkholderia TaxID=2615204 RepID=UPI003B791D00